MVRRPLRQIRAVVLIVVAPRDPSLIKLIEDGRLVPALRGRAVVADVSKRGPRKKIHAVRIRVSKSRREEAIARGKLRCKLVVVGQIGLIVIAHRPCSPSINSRGQSSLHKSVYLPAIYVDMALVPERTQVFMANGLIMERMDRVAGLVVERRVQRHSVNGVG